jgi:hypothetical protein
MLCSNFVPIGRRIVENLLLVSDPFAYLPCYMTTHFGLSHQNKVGTMAAKAKENRALRNSLINQLREIREVAQSATEQPALRALLKRRFARAQSIFEKFEPLHSAIILNNSTRIRFGSRRTNTDGIFRGI